MINTSPYLVIKRLKQLQAEADLEEVQKTVRILRHHHLQPLLLSYLESKHHHEESLTQIFTESYTRRLLFLSKVSVLLEINDALKKQQISFVFLKGAVLSQFLYQDFYIRQSNDIDIYVHPSNVKKTIQALEQIGFKSLVNFNDTQLSFFIQHRWELSLFSVQNNVILEIHWNLSYTTLPLRMRYWAQPKLTKDEIQFVKLNGQDLPLLSNDLLVPFQLINGCSNAWLRYDILVELMQLKNIVGNSFGSIVEKYQLGPIFRMIEYRYNEIMHLDLEDYSEPFRSHIKVLESEKGLPTNIVKEFWRNFLSKKELRSYSLKTYFFPGMDDVKYFKVLPVFSFLFVFLRKLLVYSGLFKPIYFVIKPVLKHRLKKRVGLND